MENTLSTLQEKVIALIFPPYQVASISDLAIILKGSELGTKDLSEDFLFGGQQGHDIIPELDVKPDEVIVDKPGRGAFAHTDFEYILRNKGIKNLILVGLTTDVCVSSTMREANDRGFDCLIVADATAAATEELRRYTLESVKMEGGIFGAVAQANEVVSVIERMMR